MRVFKVIHEKEDTMTDQKPRLSWRVVDFVTAAILAVACGCIFLLWNQPGDLWTKAMDALTPGLGGIAVGIWMIGGVLGGLIIRKPGAALFVELLAACMSAALGSQWGIGAVYSGIVQGLGAELILLIVLYRRFTLPIGILTGMGSALGAFVWEFIAYNHAKGALFNVTYFITTQISGALLAGLLGWFIVRGLAQTGALDRFAAGRERHELV